MTPDEKGNTLYNSTKQKLPERLLWKFRVYTVWIRKWQLQSIILGPLGLVWEMLIFLC
jgi:hypothetical protein